MHKQKNITLHSGTNNVSFLFFFPALHTVLVKLFLSLKSPHITIRRLAHLNAIHKRCPTNEPRKRLADHAPAGLGLVVEEHLLDEIGRGAALLSSLLHQRGVVVDLALLLAGEAVALCILAGGC